MGKTLIHWSIKDVVDTIVGSLENKFDFVLMIEGNRGLGKSTLAIHLARRVAKRFKKKESKNYNFNWRNTFVYTRKETKSFCNKWRSSAIADELINVTFNRDFYVEDQKDIIKILNMNRDHGNLFIACVPSFQTIDTQIKNLCKMRITVVRRGVGVIHTPNQITFSRDKWDQSTNEKIEKEWIKKGVKNPHYKKFTTFRGMVSFSALHPSSEEKYQKTKDAKRNKIAQEEMGIGDDEEEKDPYKIMIEMLKGGKVKNGAFVDGFAMANDLKPDTFQNGLRTRLKKEGVQSSLASYYWEKKSRKEKSGYEEREKNQEMVKMLKNKISG